jgi:pyruvate,orthophosphate dikinase
VSGQEDSAARHVYHFGPDGGEGGSHARELLGGKGANIAEMVNLGIPVPPGFTITTEVCTHVMRHGGAYPTGLVDDVASHLRRLESETGKAFGGTDNPLLLSVRSGARVSMPGMMDTVLNIGLNTETTEALARRSNNPRFALDSFRRLMQMYGGGVLGVEGPRFEHALAARRNALGVSDDSMLPPAELEALIEEFRGIIRAATGSEFPESPDEQLWGAIGAVFGSWNSARAVSYRRMNGYPDHWGTAANVQAMVFGNMGDDCATGVAFTRDPSTGEKRFFGEYLVNAQGEDVVAGIRTPLPIDGTPDSLEARMPVLYTELVGVYQRLESHYRDMQDIEFTIEAGRLWMLQTRTGKRSGRAARKARARRRWSSRRARDFRRRGSGGPARPCARPRRVVVRDASRRAWNTRRCIATGSTSAPSLSLHAVTKPRRKSPDSVPSGRLRSLR